MDRNWMKADRLGQLYEKGVPEFLEFTEKNVPDNNCIFYCPCVVCGNIENGQRNKYFITFVVMEYIKIIQHGRGMEKWNYKFPMIKFTSPQHKTAWKVPKSQVSCQFFTQLGSQIF